MNARWRIELLGRLRIVEGGEAEVSPVPREITRLRSRKTDLLLAYLAYYLDRSHPRDDLIERLWPESDVARGRARLSNELTALRRELEPVRSTEQGSPSRDPSLRSRCPLVRGLGGEGASMHVPRGAVILADHSSIRLNPAAVTTDVAAFDAALRAAERAADSPERARFLDEAVERYGGELLPGRYDDWILRERGWLEGRYLNAVETLASFWEQEGDPPRALELAWRAVKVDPWREEARRQVIRLLAATGRPRAAVRHFEELRRLLREQLDARPERATRRQVEQIEKELEEALNRTPRLSSVGEGEPRPEPEIPASLPVTASTGDPPPAEPVRPGRLPVRLTRFFGREREIARLSRLVTNGCRLVTLTGLGGSGKTRLALAAAERLTSAFPDAIWFVPLADLEDPQRIAEEMHKAMGLPRSPAVEPTEQVVAALSSQPTLLVLDNFEQLVEEGALLVPLLLERVPTLTCMVTSRRRLRLAAEREFPVPPLPVPTASAALGSGLWALGSDAQSPEPRAQSPERLLAFSSVQLFVDRARSARPDFRLSPANAADVAALCRRLEGIPLALELAAARASVLTPSRILDHLEQRLDVLKTEHQDMPPRQRALQAAFDWSYRLLTEEQRRFFAHLSVFRGSWSPEAAEAVCREPLALEYLAQLRDCSLVLAEEEAGEIRFRMRELLRRYAGGQLSAEERSDLEERHAAYYRALAEEAEPELVGAAQIERLERLEREHDNLRAGLSWYRMREDAESGLRMAGALWKFWLGHGHLREGLGRLVDLLTVAPSGAPARLKGLLGAGTLAFYQGDHEGTVAFAREARDLAGALEERSGLAQALVLLGWVETHYGRYDPAEALFLESLACSRDAEDRFGAGLALHSLGCVAHSRGRSEEARSLFDESRALFRQIGNVWGMAINGGALASVALRDGENALAVAACREALELSRKLGYTTGVADALRAMGVATGRSGDASEAVRLLNESLALQRALGARQGIAECLDGLAEVALGRGESARAARLAAAADELWTAFGTPRDWEDRADHERVVAAARDQLGEAAFAVAWSEGRSLTLEDLLAAALEGSA